MPDTKTGDDNAELIRLVRQRDFRWVRLLGRGGCGVTALLHDEEIDELLVCKKYAPIREGDRERLFDAFVREVKLLYQLHHINIVRVFNHFLYPKALAGYILMEHIEGLDIDAYLRGTPEKINEVFEQTITGFSYLERLGILHRDIRPQNIMIRKDGTVKIIDFGFGKTIAELKDFDKSISLNWWCARPKEFESSIYDFRTELYFVGMLFQEIITREEIPHFRFGQLLRDMCQFDPELRPSGFTAVEQAVQSGQIADADFTEEEILSYRAFAKTLGHHVSKIDKACKYKRDLQEIIKSLADACRAISLEEQAPDCSGVLACFLSGTFYYKKNGFPVRVAREFLSLLRAQSERNGLIILANLHNRLDSIPRYTKPQADFGDIPF